MQLLSTGLTQFPLWFSVIPTTDTNSIFSNTTIPFWWTHTTKPLITCEYKSQFSECQAWESWIISNLQIYSHFVFQRLKIKIVRLHLKNFSIWSTIYSFWSVCFPFFPVPGNTEAQGSGKRQVEIGMIGEPLSQVFIWSCKILQI